jgi:4-hydroxy-tetrahydrodipicolinate synthase
VVVAGSTGVAATLSRDERAAVVGAVRGAVGEHVPVVAGRGAPSARLAGVLTRRGCDHGADAVLVLSPPRNPDPRPYYEQVVARAGDVPVLGYHFPTVSPPGLTVEQVASLPLAGCKDSSGDAERLLATLAATPRPVWTGSSALLSFAGPVGAVGAILALANLEPERCAAAFAGDAAVQRDLVAVHLAAKEHFPRGLKELMAQRFGTSAVARAA